VLHSRTVAAGAGVTIADVACTHARGRGETSEHADQHAVVFVRRGCFSRTADGVEALLDPTTAYCMNPGEEQRYDHPHSHGDDCTAVFLAPAIVADLRREARLPSGALHVAPAVDLEHRLLVRATREPDRHELVERAIALATAALTQPPARRSSGRRPTAARAQAALARDAREALAHDPEASLGELATTLAVSPHHLSRVFRSQTGETISRHRMRLRTRAALERLAGGERDLGRLAADVGFADQSHLCRVIRRETGHTPAALRSALGG
jgi:AraC-like DNA-binding protein